MSEPKNNSTAVIVTATVLTILLNAWIFMLLLGSLHHEVSPHIPAPSFAGSLLLYVSLGFIAGRGPIASPAEK